MINRLLRAAVAAMALMTGSSVWAANVSFTGTLAGDNDVRLFTFTLAADADVTLRTWSYAGGVNAVGDVIAAGGFDVLVSLFSGLGGSAILIGANDDGSGVAADPSTGEALDSLLEAFALPAGDYTVALSEFDRFANGPQLSDGFRVNTVSGFDGRTSAWALDILGVDAANPIPAPASLALVLAGLLAAAGVRRLGR